jgi:hypothetical protein
MTNKPTKKPKKISKVRNQEADKRIQQSKEEKIRE